MGQQERQHTYRERQAKLGFVKIAVMFPERYREQLTKYVARKKQQWIRENG